MFSPSPLTHVTPEVRGGSRGTKTKHSHTQKTLLLRERHRRKLVTVPNFPARIQRERNRETDGRYPPLWLSLDPAFSLHLARSRKHAAGRRRACMHNHTTPPRQGTHPAQRAKRPATDHIRRVLDLVLDATARHLHRQHTDWFGHRWCHRVVLPAPALLYESRTWVRHRK